MKIFGFLLLVFVLLTSLFHLWGANLDKNVLGVALMVLLLSLFSDLKEFNFWGLVGKKFEKDLKELTNEKGIDESQSPKATDVHKAEQQLNVQLMDTSVGNFLSIAFDIERLLRIASTVLGDDTIKKSNLVKTKKLQERGLLTESGVKQVEAIRWLRNMLVHGRISEVNQETIDQGYQIAWNFWEELNNWVNNPK